MSVRDQPGEDPDALDEALAARRKPAKAPEGWEPGIAWSGSEGTLTTGPLTAPPDKALWAELISDWDLDPGTTEVVPGTVQVRGWDANVGGGQIERLRYYRATLRAKTHDTDRPDIDALCDIVMSRKARKVPDDHDPEVALVVPLSDWQFGKGEGGGWEAAVERVVAGIDSMGDQVKLMTKVGRRPSAVYLLGMGDLVEQCSGHYAMQAFQADLDRREQMRVARRLILRAVDEAAKLVARVVVVAVPGNHGENRNSDGKAYTTWTDNDDLAVVEQVAEMTSMNPDRYGHVSFVLAKDLTIVVNAAGVNIGLAHGHQCGKGGHPAAKVQTWWSGQIMGRQPVADADVLVTGHLHHLIVCESSGRTHLQCPAQDGGSYWYTAQSGQHAPSGQLMFGVGECYGPRKYGDLQVW